MQDWIREIRTFFQKTLWEETSEQASAMQRRTMHMLRILQIMFRELTSGDLNLRAMSLVFTTLLSFVPLIAVAFSVLKAFGVHNQIEPVLLGFMEPLGAKGEEITATIIDFVQNIKVGVLGSVGIAMLFYTIISLVQKVENAFNYVWRVKQPRSFARRFADYLSVLMIGPVLVFSALGLAAAVFNHDLVVAMQSIEPFGTLLLFASKLLPYLMIILAFTFLYTFIPNTKVNLSAALTGATVAGVMWVTLGSIFASFVASSSNYTAIYSSFAILFFFMIWLYLAWFILLTGSQVAFYIQHPRLVKLGGKPALLSPRQREKSGLWVMTLITRRFCQKEPAISMDEMESQTGLSNANLQLIIQSLEHSKLVTEVNGKVPSYVPARDVSTITVKEVLHSLRTAEENQFIGLDSASTPLAVDRILRSLNEKQGEALDGLDMKTLAMEKASG